MIWIFIRLFYESFRFAWRALTQNPLRTILSLTGVTIGIFAIIAALTVVDSLQKNIRDSLSFLGTNVLYVEKWPYIFSPNAPFWVYEKRPLVTYNEYQYLENNLQNADAVSLFAVRGGVVARHRNNSMGGLNLMGITYSQQDVYEFEIEKGRYFSPNEVDFARNVALIGSEVAATLYPISEPIGSELTIRGRRYTVVGVMKEEGETLLNTPSSDRSIYVPLGAYRKSFYTGKYRGDYTLIALKGRETDVGLVNLESEVRGIMRKYRGLRPADEDNFAINRPEAITNALQGMFDVLTMAGWFIGIFSILVGAFGIANIMFVSVSERTGIIGIQKSLGAKNYFILFQFLFEAIFLSLIGGLMGLFFVYLGTFIPLGSFKLLLMFKNIALGIGISSVVGLLAGIVPAAMASRLDPVVAIRANG